MPSVSASAVTVTANEADPLDTVKLPVKLAPPMSALLTPVIVYGTKVPLLTLVVVNVIVNDPPSFTEAVLALNAYEIPRLVSMREILVLTVGVTPNKETVSTSLPSVAASDVTVTDSVAALLETIKLPLKLAPPMSAEVIPVPEIV